jgi:hypothetical protein
MGRDDNPYPYFFPNYHINAVNSLTFLGIVIIVTKNSLSGTLWEENRLPIRSNYYGSLGI